MMMVQDVANFNSIKVQLKHVTTSDDASLNEFQFHKGTIKTPRGAPYNYPFCISIP